MGRTDAGARAVVVVDLVELTAAGSADLEEGEASVDRAAQERLAVHRRSIPKRWKGQWRSCRK